MFRSQAAPIPLWTIGGQTGIGLGCLPREVWAVLAHFTHCECAMPWHRRTHSVGQPSPLAISRTFSSRRTETLSVKPTPQVSSPGTPHSAFWFCVHRICGITYLSFCVWLISLNMMFSRFTHVIACINTHNIYNVNHFEEYTVHWVKHLHIVVQLPPPSISRTLFILQNLKEVPTKQ